MKKLQYDGLIKIAVGNSRRSTNWKNKEMLWSELCSKLEKVTRTQESQEEYKRMAKSERDNAKDVGGFVGGVLNGGRRKIDAITERRLLTLDLDSVPAKMDPWPTVTLVLGCAAVLYSTHSHTPMAPRLRLVIPLSRPVTPDEYEAIARRVAGDIGIDMCDDTTYEPHRLMYWASAPYDAEFRYELQDGAWLDADEYLARYSDWRDPLQWPTSSRKSNDVQKLAKKQGDPCEKSGIVGAFCKVFTVEDAIETFLADKYIKGDSGRYTYAGGSTSGGLVIYEDGKFAYSHHSTDPISGKLCNAFDLVRIHLYGVEDEGVAPNTAAQHMPSFRLMADKAVSIDEVKTALKSEQLDFIVRMFSDNEEEIDTDWVYLLEVNPKTDTPAATINNIYLILTHDPRLKGRYYYDEFKERPIVSGDLPWERLADRTVAQWCDSDDAGLRWMLENEYKIDHAPKIRDGIDMALNSKKVHPVREYLRSLIWDGVERADTLFIDYLGAEDSIYTREVTRKALLGAVARILKPGCKHDHMLVLVGPQGCRKSTTLAKLGKEWFSDSLYTMAGKDAYEQLQGSWLIEIAEMAATRKAEVEQIKQFVSKQEDTYRAAYARRTQSHPRQCAFFGTTNDDEFLRDATGGRRFWPVVVTSAGRIHSDELNESTVDQIWAEIVERYDAGEPWYLSDEVEEMARAVQAAHTESNGKAGLIENFLNRKLPAGWDNWELDKRLMYWDGWDDSGSGEGGFGDGEARTKVCAIEIWLELFKGDPKAYTPVQAREINGILRQLKGWKSASSTDCGPLYGRQRGFIKIY